MQLDTTSITTILVGPDNSDETSAIEAILIFLQRPIKQLSISNFSLGCRDVLKKFKQHVLAPPAAVTPAGGEAAVAAPPPLPNLPVLSLRLKFDYDDAGPDLVIAGELLMDLEDASASTMVGVRFAPANPEQLAQVYLKGRNDNQSLFNYLMATLHNHYKLDQLKLNPGGNGAERLPDQGILQRLIYTGVISARRRIDDREEDNEAIYLSTLLHTHYERHCKVDAPNDFKALEKMLRGQPTILGPQCVKAFDGLMEGLAKFGHPEPPKLTMRAELSADDLFKDIVRVYYLAASATTPSAEGSAAALDQALKLLGRYNGLRFKDLICIVLCLRSSREGVESDLEHRPHVHLVVVGESKVHVHPQMQAVFTQKVNGFLTPATGEIGTQLLLTTHSSHMATNYGFVPIRYFRRNKGTVEIKDLLSFKCSVATDPKKAAVEFLRKYLTTTRCDMFFAGKLVFIEGQVERMLLLRLIAALDITLRDKLTSTYVCTVEVGGAHAHLFHKLVESLQLPALVITGLDSIDSTTKKKAPVINGHVGSNTTLSQ